MVDSEFTYSVKLAKTLAKTGATVSALSALAYFGTIYYSKPTASGYPALSAEHGLSRVLETPITMPLWAFNDDKRLEGLKERAKTDLLKLEELRNSEAYKLDSQKYSADMQAFSERELSAKWAASRIGMPALGLMLLGVGSLGYQYTRKRLIEESTPERK